MTMTTRPTSHLIHSGFLDILSLIPESTQSQSQAQVRREGKKSMEVGLRKRKVDKEMIGPPMDFRSVMFPSLCSCVSLPHSSMAEVGADK
jgi:hypothetical protein